MSLHPSVSKILLCFEIQQTYKSIAARKPLEQDPSGGTADRGVDAREPGPASRGPAEARAVLPGNPPASGHVYFFPQSLTGRGRGPAFGIVPVSEPRNAVSV